MPAPQVDVVVFGATSFVGQILAHDLWERYGAAGALRWAIAGRSRTKLDALRASLGAGAASLPVIVADAANEQALRALCASTRVVVSTVGPYALYGEPLVRLCAESGTDYCDLTGEVQWIRRMITLHESAAARSGARIVHCCGFDSVPSDLGVHHLQQESLRRHGVPCNRVRMCVKSARGGLSGGTFASILNVLREAAADPLLRKELADPYLLCPPAFRPDVRQPEVSFAEHDADHDAWVAPFIMAAINTRVVLRTNALLDGRYGRDFRYDEAMITGRGVKGHLAAFGLATGIAAFMTAGAIAPLRRLLERYVLPAPGEGPSAEAQRTGHYDLRFTGTTPDGRRVRTRVTGDRDPGYGSTARILGQAAACLALDVPKDARAGGFWTPAIVFGDRLIERLRANAGVAFTVLDT